MTNIVTSADFNAPVSSMIGPYNKLWAWDSTDTLAAGPTTTNLADYTDLAAPNNSTHRAAMNFSSGMQAIDGKIGMFLNGFSTPSHPQPYPNSSLYMPFWSMSAKKYIAPGVKPFAGGAIMHTALTLRLGKFYSAGTDGAQLYNGFGFKVNGLYFEIIVLLWDNRTAAPHEAISNDIAGTRFIGTYVGSNSTYTTNWGASTMTGPTGSRSAQFYYDINRAQMVKALAALNIAAAPEDVELVSVTYQGELNNTSATATQYKQVQVGANFQNMVVASY